MQQTSGGQNWAIWANGNEKNWTGLEKKMTQQGIELKFIKLYNLVTEMDLLSNCIIWLHMKPQRKPQ